MSAELFSPEQAAPILVSVRTRAFDLARDVLNLAGQAGSREELLAAMNATLLGRVAEGSIESLDDAERAAFRLLAREYARIEKVAPPRASAAVRAYSLVVDARDLVVLASTVAQGRAAEEAPLAAPESPTVQLFVEALAEGGLTRLGEVLASLGYRTAARLVEAGAEIPLGLALDLELLRSFYEALDAAKGTPAEGVLCGRVDMYALRVAAGAAGLARRNPALGEMIASNMASCRLDRERLVGVLGEEAAYAALEQALAGNPYLGGYVESSLPIADAVIHGIRREYLRPLAEMYSLGDPLEEWYPAPVMELLLLGAEDVAALVSGIEMGLTREELPALLSVRAR